MSDSTSPRDSDLSRDPSRKGEVREPSARPTSELAPEPTRKLAAEANLPAGGNAHSVAPMKKVSLRFKLAVLAVSVIVALILGEIALRLFWHNPYRAESPDRVVRLRMQHDNTDHVLDRSAIDGNEPQTRLRTNERGYIQPAPPFSSGDVTVAFLGGSTTECIVVQEELRFPALTAELLKERGARINALNAARAGNTLHDSINVLFNHVLLDKPDVVVIMHATNDIGVLRRDPNYSSRMGQHVSLASQGKWAAQELSSRSYLAALIRRVATFSRVAPGDGNRSPWRTDAAVADQFHIDQFAARLRVFIHICRDFGIEPVMMTQPLSGTTTELTPEWADLGAQDRFNEMIRSVGKELDATVIDLADHLKRNVPGWDEPMHVFYDGMHVTDRGSRIYAEHIAEKLLPLVRQRIAAQQTARTASAIP